MPRTEKNTFNETNKIQIREINDLIEKGRLIRDEQSPASNAMLEKAFELSDEINYLTGKAISLRELSVNYLQSRLFKNAVKTLDQAGQLFAESGNNSIYRKCLIELSDIYFMLGDYEFCLETLLVSLNVSWELKEPLLIAEIHNKIGNVFKVINEFQKAIEHHKKALELYEQNHDQVQIAMTNYYLGNCYNWADELDVAFNYLDNSLKSAMQQRDVALKIKPLGSLAILYTKNKNFAKAEEYFFMAIEAVEHTENEKLKADLLKSLGNLYIQQKNYQKAISTLHEALDITDRLDIKNPAHLIHLYLSTAHENLGNYRQALEHHKFHKDISREITNEEIAIKTKGVQLKFDLEEAKKLKELAEHSARLKDRFLASISHELRTPLNGVLGMANLLLDTHPTPEQLEYINTIKLSSNNLIQLIDDILDYSKIRSGEINLTEERFNLMDMLTELAHAIKKQSHQKRINFSMVVQPALPSLLIGDRTRLKQILLNLLTNAVKFTNKGTVTFEVTGKPSEPGFIILEFSVTDTGIGISEARLPGIFDSFFKDSSDESRFNEGTGLGLVIVKQLVDLLHGTVTVNSKLNEGSVFHLELRYKYEGIETDSGLTGREVPLHNLSDISLLLVEDNKVNQFLGKQILTKLGFRVQIAGNGKEALEMINKHNFNLILMDVNMPVMNGYELTQAIRNQLDPPKNSIPIVALTAYASGNEKEKAMSLGMNDYVTKPYSPHELLHVIIKQLNLKQPVDDIVSESKPVVEENTSSSEQLIRHLTEMMQGNEEDLIKMLDMYIEQLPSINNLIKTGISKKNWEDVYQQAHKLKSSVKLLNINRMSELITMIEEYAKARENTELIAALFEAFKKECIWVVNTMQQRIK